MKKSNLLVSLLALSSIFCLSSSIIYNSSNANNISFTEKYLKEGPTDLFNSEEGTKISQISEYDKLDASKIYTQFAFNSNDNCYYLRFAVAVKGNIQKIIFTRSVTYNDQTAKKDFEVSTIYAGIKANGTTTYYDGSNITSDENYRGDYYWACYTAKYTSSELINVDLNVSVTINESEYFDSKVISLYDVVSQTAYLMENESIKYEAEDMINETIVGKIESSNDASNGKLIGSLQGSDTLQFNHVAEENKKYVMKIAATTKGNISENAFTAFANNKEIGTISIDNRNNWTGNFYEYYAGTISINNGDNSIKIQRNNTGNLDYFTLDSYLELPSEKTSSQVYEVHSFTYQNVLLKLNGHSNDSSTAILEVNGERTADGSLINLKPGLNKISIITGNENIDSISLTHYNSQQNYDKNKLIIEAEDGITTSKVTPHNNYSGTLGLDSYNGTTYLPINLDDTSYSKISILYSCYNSIDESQDYLDLYINNTLVDSSTVLNIGTWDYTSILSIDNIKEYLHNGDNVIAIKAKKNNIFNLDAVLLSEPTTFQGAISETYSVLDATLAKGRLTTGFTRIENISGNIQYNINSIATQAEIQINYAANGDKSEGYQIIVNDEIIASVDVVSTGGWGTFKSSPSFKINLKEGNNTIIIKHVNGGYNFQDLTINPLAA